MTLAGEEAGTGRAVVLLHGLTATRRYVLMGSRLLERSGLRVVAYDARGHGGSAPAPDPRGYGYELLAGDLLAVLDELGLERPILTGASMGAHTALRFALAHPERVGALCLITPSFDPALPTGPENGVEGFVRAYDLAAVPLEWRRSTETVLRQRLATHAHPQAVADALEVVPRSRPFESIDELAHVAAPTVVVASRDEADPGHPLEVGERYARAIPAARLVVEDGGSPIAWRGGALSRIILELAQGAGAGAHS